MHVATAHYFQINYSIIELFVLVEVDVIRVKVHLKIQLICFCFFRRPIYKSINRAKRWQRWTIDDTAKISQRWRCDLYPRWDSLLRFVLIAWKTLNVHINYAQINRRFWMCQGRLPWCIYAYFQFPAMDSKEFIIDNLDVNKFNSI